jgi:tetratricopeptide (TPR) repeat protein
MTSKRAAGLIEAGVWLQMAGDVDGARDIYRRALAMDPTNARARSLYLSAGGTLDNPTVMGSPPPELAAPPPPRASTPPPSPSPPVEAPATPPPPVRAPPKVQPRALEQTRIISLAELQAEVSKASSPPETKGQQLEALLKEAAELRAEGELDRASGVVLRALVLDGTSLDAHEAAYRLLLEQGRTEAAQAELVQFLKLCAQRGESERAQPYLLKMVKLKAGDSELDPLKTLPGGGRGDPHDTLPPVQDETIIRAPSEAGPPSGGEPSRTLSEDAAPPWKRARRSEKPPGRRRH